MRSYPYRVGAIAAALIFVVSNTDAAGESRQLAAPVYPGAVPGVLVDGVQVDPELVLTFAGGKTLDCDATSQTGNTVGPWCFLTRDSIDKVRAFYEKAAGSMRRVQNAQGAHGYEAFVERAWFPGVGEESAPGYYYAGVSVHALPAPPVKGRAPAPAAMGDGTWAGQEDYGFYAGTRFFNAFLDAVDMFGDPSKRPIPDLDKLYAQRNKVEAAFFQRRGPSREAVDDALYKHYGELRAQRQQSAHSGTMSAYQQYGAQASQRSVGPTDDEDAQFNAVMAADPALQQRYVALTQQAMTLMQQGKDEEADEIFAQIDEMEQQTPALSAQAQRQQARVASAQAADEAAEEAIRAAGDSQLDQAIWGTGIEMLDALDKEAYYTLIVIDSGLPKAAQEYSKDRAVIEAATQGAIPHTRLGVFGIEYAGFGPSTEDTGEPVAPEEKEGAGDKLKRGLSKLKDLTGN
ncbi:MAG: hypothetical protein OEM20_06490 [Gammaproteobacteria bacterium]|nr:hypothetical protein [Gammaproteobacteria bacterium]